MWQKVKGWLGLNKPWQRWDERKQQQVQEYIKQKASGTHTLDVWTLAAELIIQRYAPDHMALSQEEYESVKAQLRAKIEKNLTNPPAVPTKINTQDPQQMNRRPEGVSLEYWSWLNQTLKDAGLPSNLDLK